jgi:hypothetical protein
MADSIIELEKAVQTKQTELDFIKKKTAEIRTNMMDEIKQVFPKSIDKEVERVIGYNSERVNNMSSEELKELRSSISNTKEKTIARALQALMEDKLWYSCDQNNSYEEKGLFDVIKSIENDFFPAFEKAKFKRSNTFGSGMTDMYLHNFSFFDSARMEGFQKELKSVGQSFCSKQRELGHSKERLESAKAVARFRG